MTTISSTGIGSGLDVNSIITQLMAIESQPLTALQKKATTIQSTVSEYGKIKSAVSTLNDLAAKLASTTTWGQTTVTSSNPAAVTAATSGSAAGSYSVQVQSLASVQTLASGVFASTTSTPGAGTLNIELGTWGTGQTSFTPKSGATSINVAITATDTLADMRDKINAAGAGVTALIMTDASGSRLLMRSSATGADNAFRSTVTDADGNNTDAIGLSQFAFGTSTKNLSLNQTAANAAATINGLAVSSSTNTLANIVDGLSLTLSAVTTSAVSIDVVPDSATLTKTLTDFAAAYTAVVKLIATDTKYDAASKKGGVLQGDNAAVALQRQLRTLAGSSSGASSVFGHLSDIGLQLQSDGSMSVNATKLTSALANLPELKKAFSNLGGTDTTLNGFGKQFRDMTSAMLGIEGSLTTRSDGLSKQLSRNQADQDSMNIRLAGIEKRMRAQYTALDTAMAQLNSSSGYMSQQIAAWAKA